MLCNSKKKTEEEILIYKLFMKRKLKEKRFVNRHYVIRGNKNKNMEISKTKQFKQRELEKKKREWKKKKNA